MDCLRSTKIRGVHYFSEARRTSGWKSTRASCWSRRALFSGRMIVQRHWMPSLGGTRLPSRLWKRSRRVLFVRGTIRGLGIIYFAWFFAVVIVSNLGLIRSELDRPLDNTPFTSKPFAILCKFVVKRGAMANDCRYLLRATIFEACAGALEMWRYCFWQTYYSSEIQIKVKYNAKTP